MIRAIIEARTVVTVADESQLRAIHAMHESGCVSHLIGQYRTEHPLTPRQRQRLPQALRAKLAPAH